MNEGGADAKGSRSLFPPPSGLRPQETSNPSVKETEERQVSLSLSPSRPLQRVDLASAQAISSPPSHLISSSLHIIQPCSREMPPKAATVVSPVKVPPRVPPLPFCEPSQSSSSVPSRQINVGVSSVSAPRSSSSLAPFPASVPVRGKEGNHEKEVYRNSETDRKTEKQSDKDPVQPPISSFLQSTLLPESARLNAAVLEGRQKAEWKETKLKELKEMKRKEVWYSREIETRLAVSQPSPA
mmetsp:Transcript_40431/g.79694  ORF Transcript_40431/g.79694 Transcript_40431/m.79694 type:complete len:241 (-) Transcript_40431:407-1129(-)